MNETVVAVDQSSRACGVAVVRGRDVVWSDVLRFSCGGHSQRRQLLVHMIVDICRTYAPAYVVMEQARLFSSDRTTGRTYISRAAQRVLDRMIGSVIDAVYPLPVYVVGTQQWKYAVLSSRTATKLDAVWYVKQFFGKSVGHDEADAICMALCGAAQPELLERDE